MRLCWHLALPVWSTQPPQPLFDLSPQAVIADPVQYAQHWSRILTADIGYPLDMFALNGRWVIMDGYHRLARCHVEGQAAISVRQHPAALLAQVRA